MTADQQKRVEEIRHGNFNYWRNNNITFLLDFLREQQAELKRETVVRKTAESEAHNHAIRTSELYIERERQQAELEALRKAQTPLDGDELAAAAFVANRDTPYESTVRELLRRALATIEVLRKDRTRLTAVVEQLRMILTGAYFRMQDQIDASRAASEPQTADAAATRATEPESKLCDHGKGRSKQFCEECRLDEDSEAEMPGGFNK